MQHQSGMRASHVTSPHSATSAAATWRRRHCWSPAPPWCGLGAAAAAGLRPLRFQPIPMSALAFLADQMRSAPTRRPTQLQCRSCWYEGPFERDLKALSAQREWASGRALFSRRAQAEFKQCRLHQQLIARFRRHLCSYGGQSLARAIADAPRNHANLRCRPKRARLLANASMQRRRTRRDSLRLRWCTVRACAWQCRRRRITRAAQIEGACTASSRDLAAYSRPACTDSARIQHSDPVWSVLGAWVVVLASVARSTDTSRPRNECCQSAMSLKSLQALQLHSNTSETTSPFDKCTDTSGGTHGALSGRSEHLCLSSKLALTMNAKAA